MPNQSGCLAEVLFNVNDLVSPFAFSFKRDDRAAWVPGNLQQGFHQLVLAALAKPTPLGTNISFFPTHKPAVGNNLGESEICDQ